MAMSDWAMLVGRAEAAGSPPPHPPSKSCIRAGRLLPHADSQAGRCFAQPPWENNNATSKTSFGDFYYFSFSSVLQ